MLSPQSPESEAFLSPAAPESWLPPAAPDPLPAVNDGETPPLMTPAVAMLTASALKQRSLKKVLVTFSSRDEDGNCALNFSQHWNGNMGVWGMEVWGNGGIEPRWPVGVRSQP